MTFEDRVRGATGLSLEDALILGKAEADRRAELIRQAGYCCEAGAVARPGRCPWHDGERLDNPKSAGAPDGWRWGYLPCGCRHDGFGGHAR